MKTMPKSLSPGAVVAAVALAALFWPQPASGGPLKGMAEEIAAKVRGATREETGVVLWPLSVSEKELQPVAVIFEDELLTELAGTATKPAIQWITRRWTERALQEIAESRRAQYDEDKLPAIGKLASAHYGIHGRLLIDVDDAAGTVKLGVRAAIVDVERGTAPPGGGIELDVLVAGDVAADMIRSWRGRLELRDFTPQDEVDRLVLTGRLHKAMRDADRAYDFSQNSEAMKLYGEAQRMAEGLGLTREHASIFYRLGNLHELDHRHDAALAYYGKALELDPGHSLAHNNAGKVWLEREDYGKALDEFAAALELKPDFALARYNRGLAVLKSGVLEKAALRGALEDFRAAARQGASGFAIGRDVEGSEKVAECHYFAGATHHLLDEDDRSRECFALAVKENPKHASAHHELMAMAYWNTPRDCAAVRRHARAFLDLQEDVKRRSAAQKALGDCTEGAPGGEAALDEAMKRVRKMHGDEYAEQLHRLLFLWASEEKAKELPDGALHRVEMSLLTKPAEADGRAVHVGEGARLRSRTDLYKLVFSADFDCWVYVWQLDTAASVAPLFPLTDPKLPRGEVPSNPIRRNAQVQVPGDWWYTLDDQTGRESVLFVVSTGRRPDIEKLLQYFNERAWGRDATVRERCDTVLDAVTGTQNWIIRVGATLPWEIQKPGIRARGPLSVVQDSGQTEQAQGPGGSTAEFHPLVITTGESEIAGRFWFEHIPAE